ncbi:MAG: hypothetical protein HOW97_21975 [Catenulispora sp.]|nr:hypothetical protein [Catenulispora sp.]
MNATVIGFVVVAGAVGTVGLALAGWLGANRLRRWCLLAGLGAAGVVVGLMGTMMQGYTVRVGGSAPSLRDVGDPTSGGGGSAGVALPVGALAGLVVFAGLLLVAGVALRQPLAVLTAGGGWLAMVALLMFAVGNSGDVLLPNDTAAQTFVYGGLIIAFCVGVLAYQWQLTDRLAARAAVKRPADRVR